MNIRLFEIDGRTVKPTEHCYMISWLKVIIDEYPEDNVKVFAYVYYMSYLGPDNPYANVDENDREDKIMRDLQPEFSTEDPIILKAIEKCQELFMTPTMKSYDAIKTMLENLNVYLKNTPVTDGRDGNIGALIRVAKEFKHVRESFKGISEDVQVENKVLARGSSKLPYDLKR
tara:strand:+ start:3891 stop:4409 length:519 start_codon:yes stop_codon:yes gene_type:complete